MKKKLMVCALCACMAASLCACKVNVNINNKSDKDNSVADMISALSEEGGEQSIDDVPDVVDSTIAKEDNSGAVTADATIESDLGYSLTYDPSLFKFAEFSDTAESFTCKTEIDPPVTVSFQILDDVEGKTAKEVAEEMAKPSGSKATVDETEIGDGIPAQSVYIEDTDDKGTTYVFVSYVLQAGDDLMAIEISSYAGCDSAVENAIEGMLGTFVANCKGAEEDGLSIHDRNLLLEPGTHPAKPGYYPLKEGGVLVAGNIPMPDVTADMLYWWFAWHGLEPLRYAIWDPEDHFDVQINEEGKRRSLDPSVPMEEKAWGATHTVQESIGGPPDEIVIMFTEPAKMGFDPSKIGTAGCEFMVAANGRSVQAGKRGRIKDRGV